MPVDMMTDRTMTEWDTDLSPLKTPLTPVTLQP